MKAMSHSWGWIIATVLLMTGSAIAADLKPFEAGSFAAIRNDRARAAEPMIVHLWGVTCAPCRAEMPEWGRLRASGDAGVRMVFVHAERAPPRVGLIMEFLVRSGLEAADNWYFADVFLDRLRFEIDPDWHGELPMTILIGRDGQTTSITGPADPDEIKQWITAQDAKASK